MYLKCPIRNETFLFYMCIRKMINFKWKNSKVRDRMLCEREYERERRSTPEQKQRSTLEGAWESELERKSENRGKGEEE